MFWLNVLATALLVYSIQTYLSFRQKVKAVAGARGYRGLVSTGSVFSDLIPWAIPGVSAGRNQKWNKKYTEFAKFGDITADVAAWPSSAGIVYNVADPQALKEITSNRAKFPKPTELYASVLVFGGNIVATEGEEWKRHRKIAAPAFSEPNNRLVWSETVRIMLDLFENVWGDQEEVVVDHAAEVTLEIALMIIGSAGFGRQISWEDDAKIGPGHTLSFKDALHLVSTRGYLKLLVPAWAMNLHEELRKCERSFKDLQLYMQEMVDSRRTASGDREERHDLFTSLLDANMDEKDGEAKLKDSDLIGNIFVFLLAGHETTAHTICFTFGLLAMYQHEQDILYEHVMKTVGNRIPTYEDMNSLSQCLAVLYETLRMFPPVNGIPKVADEDCTLVALDENGKKRTYAVPKGAQVNLHTPGLHYNPRYWPDPYEFRPQRFNEDWPRDAFLPFSGGPRACLGRRFAEVESVAILTMLIQRYKIEVKDEPEFAKETFEERRARIFQSIPGVTMTPVRMPLVFKKR